MGNNPKDSLGNRFRIGHIDLRKSNVQLGSLLVGQVSLSRSLGLLLLLALLLGRKGRHGDDSHQCGGEKDGETFHEKFVRVFQNVSDRSQ
ncbi:MAG: hypothetical protein BGO12_09195 [Verrucomicrobia bacterium 61-8]|nr:MAG: hypothetical protein BGO12_09195 [Verrucomicrobia bacterium 61-8]